MGSKSNVCIHWMFDQVKYGQCYFSIVITNTGEDRIHSRYGVITEKKSLQKYRLNPSSVYIRFVVQWNTDIIILIFLLRIGMNIEDINL